MIQYRVLRSRNIKILRVQKICNVTNECSCPFIPRCVRDLMSTGDRKKKKRICPDCRKSLNSRLMLICYDELKAAYGDGRTPTFPRYQPSPSSDDQPLWYSTVTAPTSLTDDLCFWLICCTWCLALRRQGGSRCCWMVLRSPPVRVKVLCKWLTTTHWWLQACFHYRGVTWSAPVINLASQN